MKTIVSALLAAIACLSLCDREVNAFGLFDRNGCDQGCCESACTDPCCDAAACCDTACTDPCAACDSCDACVGCGQSGTNCGCLGRMKLLGCLRPSDHCFDDFISPMINFVHFEDPRTLTEVRPIYLYHTLPDRVGTLQVPGGAVQLYAMQIRLALTERLSLIAVKDGYIVDHIKDGPLDDLLDDGFAAVTAGLKYNILRDPCRGRLASIGFTYELPVGSRRTLQEVGDGEFHIFASGGRRLCKGNAHYLTAIGFRIPVDDDVQSSSFMWSNHLDYRITKRNYFVSELAWFNWMNAAENGAPLGVGGHDIFNLPSGNISGNNLVTKNFGLKYKPNRNIEAGIAYEFPLTNREDIIDGRLQLDLILRR